MDSRLLSSGELGVRLELVGGVPLWEAQPPYRHQKAIDRIRAAIRPDPDAPCRCVHVSDVYVEFPDGSLKRPDVSLFCREPEDEDEAIRPVPEAVIEVISKGYEYKDLEIGPNFYLAQGVKDVVVFNPYTLVVLHVRRNQAARHVSPVEIHFECGCSTVV
jgi:Uma2 family endonuclease